MACETMTVTIKIPSVWIVVTDNKVIMGVFASELLAQNYIDGLDDSTYMLTKFSIDEWSVDYKL